MKRAMAIAVGMAITTTTLGAQSTGGVAPHVAILKTQADTIRSFVLRTAERFRRTSTSSSQRRM